MTLSSLFNSLDRLDETDDEEEDFSWVYQSPEPVNNIPHQSIHSRKRAHMDSNVDENAEPKRTKIFMLEHASSTLEPRHGGTGAPLVNTVTESDHLEQCTSTQTMGSFPFSSPSTSRSNVDLASAPIQSKNDQKYKTALHEQTEPMPSMKVARSRVKNGRASVAESPPIATRSKPDLSQPIVSKPVSRPGYKSSTIVVRPRVKDQSSSTIPSNSFRDPDHTRVPEIASPSTIGTEPWVQRRK
ncbi:hypothetical protein OPQ81_002294 [Rhizoctonia solani]|nr:hypothetical protein OPQ81_002294 [Rhizoctonia solani]